MPQFEITNAAGYRWSCASSDPELLGKWLMETVVREFPDTNSSYHSPVTIRVFPMSTPDGSADWPGHGGAWTALHPAVPYTATDRVRQVIGWLQAELNRSNNV